MIINYTNWLIRYRYLIVLATLIFVGILASGGRFLQFNNDYRVFFDGDNPQLVAFENLQNTYTKNDNVLITLTPKNKDVFNNDTFKAVVDLTEKAWQTPYSTRVDSVSNFQHTYAEEDDLIVEDLIETGVDFTSEQLAKIKHYAINEPTLVHRLVSQSGHITAINITVELPSEDLITAGPKIVSYVRALVADARTEYPEIDFHFSGIVMMNNAFSESAQYDVTHLIPIALGTILIILLLFIRGIFRLFSILLVILFTIASAMGTIGWFGISLTPPLMSLPTIVMTLAVADCVHIIITWIHEVRNGEDKLSALRESMRVNFMPVFLTSITTAIGFLALNFSDAPPFRQLGNFSAIGVMYAFFFAVTFLPAMLAILPCNIKPVNKSRSTAIMMRFANFVIDNRSVLLWGSLITLVGIVLFIPKNTLNDNFVQYFDERIDFRTNSEYVSDNLGGIYFIDYSLPANENGGISKPQFQQQVERFVKWISTQSEVVHVNSITDTMKRLNKNLHNDDQSWYKLPDKRDLAAQYLLLYEMSLPYGLDLNNQIDIAKSATRVSVSLHILKTQEVLAFEEKVLKWMQENTPDIVSYGSSPTVMFSHIGMTNIKSMVLGSTIALILISFLLILVFSSVKYGLISLIPNLLPVGVAFGLWGIFVSQVGMSLAFVMAMTMGIVIDDTIHFMSKYLRALREKNLSSKDAVRYAFSSVGVALWITSLALVAGFFVLGTSAFKLNADMGIMTSMTIALALITDFLLLPPLLIWIAEKNEQQPIKQTVAVTE